MTFIEMKFVMGLDLGQAQDFTALAILERARNRSTPHSLRYLDRLPRNTPYPAQVRRVAELLGQEPLRGSTVLIVDATGVGRPVVDLLYREGLYPVAVTITGGEVETYENGYRAPKRLLVTSAQVLLQQGRLKFAAELPLVGVLKQELLSFRVKIDALTGHDSYGAWREGQHDDLVLALCLAAWWAEKLTPGEGELPPSGGKDTEQDERVGRQIGGGLYIPQDHHGLRDSPLGLFQPGRWDHLRKGHRRKGD